MSTHPLMKNTKNIILFVLLLLSFWGRSQNIVNNPGFETYSSLPTYANQLVRASGWSNCNGNYNSQGTWGSPDYLSLLGTGLAQLPCGYLTCSPPHSGNGVAAFITYNGFHPNCREYIRTFLTTTMVPGTQYSISFWLTNGSSPQAKFVTNNIGVLFSKDSTWQGSVCTVMNRVPQLNITSVIDTASWKMYTFTYTADSAYKYMTLGNYFTDANTTIITKNNSNQLYSWYLIDDFRVSVASEVTGIEKAELPLNNISILPNPGTGEFLLKGDREAHLEIINALGQRLFSVFLTEANSYTYKFLLSEPGIYYAVGAGTSRKIIVSD
jgi:hypothetical protein